MKLFLFLLSISTASQGATTVSQPILNPDGTPASGTAFIKLTQPCRSGSSYVGDKTIVVRFSGIFSVNLMPNDTCAPAGTTYTVTWFLTGGMGRTQTWRVPSGGPVTVDSVIVPTSGLADGSYCVVAGLITPGACGGSSGGKTWAQLSGSWAGLVGSWASQ